MKKILIVEDETALREIYVLLFKMHEFEVYEAANGRLALEQMPDIRPDVIVLDVLMPVMGGIKFLKEVKLKEHYADTKVLMLTNLSDQKTITDSQKLGAQKYLLKASASPAELVAAVKDLLET